MAETSAVFNVPRGTAYITIQQLVFYATAFLYYVLLVRILSLSQIGEVSLLTAASSIFTTLTQVALPLAATRFISLHIGKGDRATAAGVATESLKLLLALAAAGLLISIIASPWIGAIVFKTADASTPLVATFVASFLLDLIALYGAYFLGLGLYADLVFQNVLYFPLSRGLGLVLAYEGFGPLGIPIGWGVGAAGALLLSLYLWKGKLKGVRSYPAKPLLIFGVPLFASGIIAFLQAWGDIALLQGILGQLGNTGAYYIVVSSVGFLAILWSPVAGALYPALSSSYANEGPPGVSARLAVASRLINVTVLPTGVALAVVARTALDAVFGASVGSQSLPFAIIAVSLIFTAQGLLLITALQSVSKTTQILAISLIATIIDLVAVALGANFLGTTAGAIGRALLALVTALLAWLSLRRALHAPITEGLAKALALTVFTALPLALVDNSLTLLNFVALPRLLLLVGLFVLCFLIASRQLNVFSKHDLDLLKNALPASMSSILQTLSRALLRTDTRDAREPEKSNQQQTPAK